MRKIFCCVCHHEKIVDDAFLQTLKKKWQLADLNAVLWTFGSHVDKCHCQKCGTIGKVALIGDWPSISNISVNGNNQAFHPSNSLYLGNSYTPRRETESRKPSRQSKHITAKKLEAKNTMPPSPSYSPPKEIQHRKRETKRDRESIDAYNYRISSKQPGFIKAQKKWLEDNGLDSF